MKSAISPTRWKAKVNPRAELRREDSWLVAHELEHYTVIGMVERWKGGADVRVPGGDCWHCGTAIAYCVQIRHTLTGQRSSRNASTT